MNSQHGTPVVDLFMSGTAQPEYNSVNRYKAALSVVNGADDEESKCFLAGILSEISTHDLEAIDQLRTLIAGEAEKLNKN